MRIRLRCNDDDTNRCGANSAMTSSICRPFTRQSVPTRASAPDRDRAQYDMAFRWRSSAVPARPHFALRAPHQESDT